MAPCEWKSSLFARVDARFSVSCQPVVLGFDNQPWTLDDDLGDGDDVEVMVMMVMVIMVIITIGCQCMETKEMQALENDYASAEADEGLVVQPTRCKRNSDGDGEDHQEDDELFLEEV